MPSGTAQKPGDVQTAMSGKTIEIINTDAEGRLVLADGLTYARQLGATHLIDAATLTGAISVALGKMTAGAFSNDDATYGKFEAALKVSGEKFWRMPLGEEYADLIKSDIGDIKNTGGRYGGASPRPSFCTCLPKTRRGSISILPAWRGLRTRAHSSPKARAGLQCGRFWSGCGATRRAPSRQVSELASQRWSSMPRGPASEDSLPLTHLNSLIAE